MPAAVFNYQRCVLTSGDNMVAAKARKGDSKDEAAAACASPCGNGDPKSASPSAVPVCRGAGDDQSPYAFGGELRPICVGCG